MAQPTQYIFKNGLVIANTQSLTLGVPLTLLNPIPAGMVSFPLFFFQGTSATFNIVGLNEYSLPITREFSVTNGNNFGTFSYSQISSITPIKMNAATSILVKTNESGYTKPYLCDVWNKAALYSYSVFITTLPSGGTPGIIPQYTLDPLPNWTTKGNQVGAQPDYPITTKWINAPALSPTLEANKTSAGSLSNIPITALRFSVTDPSSTANLTATIMQQGGFF